MYVICVICDIICGTVVRERFNNLSNTIELEHDALADSSGELPGGIHEAFREAPRKRRAQV